MFQFLVFFDSHPDWRQGDRDHTDLNGLGELALAGVVSGRGGLGFSLGFRL